MVRSYFMTVYHLFLDDRSIVIAYADTDGEGTYLGEIECGLQDLTDLISFCQAAVDASIINLANKADQLFNKRTKQDIN